MPVRRKLILALGKRSLDGDSTDGSKKVQLSDSSVDVAMDPLDRKLLLKSAEKTTMSGSKLSKRESLKEKKKSYRSQKKEVAREIMNSASDRSFVLMADWLKVRGTLKGWTKLWCVCKPSMLIIYKSEKMKNGHWVGTILLNTCQLLQRPSKKEGFCFKLFHPLDQSIWATKGPKGETIGAFVQPLPMSYLIFRAPSENQGKCWMDGLELALRCTSLIKRTTSRPYDLTTDLPAALATDTSELSGDLSLSVADDTEDAVESEEIVDHYSEDDDHSSMGLSESDFELAEEESTPQNIPAVEETVYVSNENEELGQQGDECQTEEVNDENKSLIWTLVKQVRPGMDLSKVVLPTFILEPRSFLDKLTDYYYHADILSQAVQQETALERMKYVVKWYLSGFYKKPKGLKKPYNPIIGETFRCYWVHPQTKSRTFYVAEQISHHPPVSAFHVTNRHDGFNINGCILAKSKFYGNSISAILDGVATLTFLERGEDYLITMPYAHCKGILLGTLTMEMGGKVTLDCPKTGYHCDLDFKLKPFFGNGESANKITGRIRMGSEVLCTFEGHWDQQIYIKEITNRERVVFWDPSAEVRAGRLVRHTVPVDAQLENESERLWKKVSEAVVLSDMHAATNEKHRLEEKQRTEAKERHKSKEEWIPRWFVLDAASNKWIYKHVDVRPWDPMTDCIQYEKDYAIRTQTVHTVPQVWKGATALSSHERLKSYSSGVTNDDSCSSDCNGDCSDENTKHCRNTNRGVSGSDSTPGGADRTRAPRSGTAGDKMSRDTMRHSPATPRSKAATTSAMVNGGDDHRKSATPERIQKRQAPMVGSSHGKELESPTRHVTTTDGEDSPIRGKTPHSHNKTSSLPREFSLGDYGGNLSSSSGVHSPPLKSSPSHPVGSSHAAGGSRDLQVLVRVAEMQKKMQRALNELVTQVAEIQKAQQVEQEWRRGESGVLVRDGGGGSSSVDGAGSSGSGGVVFTKEWALVAMVLVFQIVLQWYFSR